jgi:16S rRNA processing protein RimM
MMPPAESRSGEAREVTLGRIVGVFGIKGWVKVKSYTEPAEGILDYGAWQLAAGPGVPRRTVKALEGRRHGTLVVARLDGVADRDAAAALAHCDIVVPRADLPEPGPGQYYWADLEGLEVVTTEGVGLGRVEHFVETPANPVMVVRGERERWLPLVPQCVKTVDLDAGRVVVDWDPEF